MNNRFLGVCAVLAIGACSVLLYHRSQPHAPTLSTSAVASASNAPEYQAPQTVSRLPRVSQATPPSCVSTNPAATPTPRTLLKRAWDSGYLASLGHPAEGSSIRFELTAGSYASGTIRHVEFRNGELSLISGELTAPEAGRFFFQKQSLPGKAGAYAGVVEFPASRKAYRIEPTGPGGSSELVERKLEEVICLMMPRVEKEEQDSADTAEIPPLDPQDVPDLVPGYNDGIISLQSLKGATAVLYIDYRGGSTTTWGGITYTKPSASNAQIKDVWKRVCEDYMAFNINVTTDIRVYEAAPENSRQRVIVTPTTTAAPGAGGVAYLNSWNWTGDTPCWAFYSTGKSAAEVIAHEAGHTLSLSHDGRTTPSEGYFGGQGSGVTGWAPIMGVGYYQPVAQWSKGEYAYANNTEDDLAMITQNNNNVAYRPDDTGATLSGARYLDIASNFTAFAEGVIERTADTDALRFTTTGGQISLTALPVGDWADLALQATLADATDAVIASNCPQNILSASIATNLAAGTYTFRVTGAGRNSALTNGFSNYASLGYYTVTGSVAGARLATYLSVQENSTNGTLVGTVQAADTNGNPLVYTIITGNVANAFSLNNSGTLTVSNSSAINYETLASNTQFTVQYELFVTISNTVNPALTEVNRRVVVQILDVNETPSLPGFTATILAHTQTGTVIGTLTGSDPDAFSTLTYAILSGNTGNAFALASGSGLLTVAADISVATQTVYTLTVRATDNGSPAKTQDAAVLVTVVPNTTGLLPGSISYAAYDGIGSGTYVSNLTLNARFPTDPTLAIQCTLFEGLANRADSYGAAMRGYLIPPASGTYTFWVASDDNSELWLSATTNPATMTRIATVTGNTSPRVWTQYSSQKSTNQTLVAGQAYYVEARLKEGGGDDHIAVAWKGPATANQTNVISGLYLAPYLMNYVPHPTGFTNTIRRNLQANSKICRITVSDQNTGDTSALAITAGNGSGLFSLGSDGWIRVSNDAALPTASSPVTLTIRATDNGTPPLSGTSTVRIVIADTNAISVSGPQWEVFNGIGSGAAVSDLTGNAKYPSRPDALTALSSFASPVDTADSYGSRIRAYVTPPSSGDYQFFIASDDSSQLKFSRTTNAASAQVIASLSSWVSANVYTQYVSQVSAPQTNLVAGQAYYIETLHKEGSGGDHVSVAWAGPGLTGTNVIGGAYLTPLDINYNPQATNYALRISYTNSAGSWLARIAATDSPLDSLCFKLMTGNTNSTFALDPDSGDLTLANTALTASLLKTNFPLTVSVQDSGYGGLFPIHSASVTVTVSVVGPYAIGFTNTLRRNSQAGFKAGRVTVSDPDRGGTAAFAITAGNSNGLFSVNQDGWVRVLNETALLAASSPVTLTIRATDNGTPPLADNATALITLNATNALPSSPCRELFYNISGANVSDLTGSAKYPGRPDALASLTNLASPLNIGDSYGSRIRANIIAPSNGNYKFFISSDDSSQLKFSRTANPTGATVIASVSGWVNPGVWTSMTSQASVPQSNLVATQAYYLEALHKENTGNDHVYVAWAVPGMAGTNIIAGSYLTAPDINYSPTATNHLLRVSSTNLVGTWIGRVAATDSPLDTLTFKITGGNTNSTFALDPDTGDLTLANTALTVSQAKTYFPLTIAVQDSGYGGLYPLHGTSVVVTVTVIGPPTVGTFTPQGNTLNMVWLSTPGVRYQLQSTTNLSTSAWQDVGTPVTGTGVPLTNAIPLNADPQRFFRLLLLE